METVGADRVRPYAYEQYHANGRPICFDIPLTPKPWARTGFNKNNGAIYKTKKTQQYQNGVGWYARAAMTGRRLLTGPCAVRLQFYLAIPERFKAAERAQAADGLILPVTGGHDADNLAKAILDAFNNIVYADDQQVVDLNVIKRYAIVPHVEVKIYPLGEVL